MRHFLAWLIAYASDCTHFFAPYVNSYKRFTKGSFAPTKVAWSIDNRTAGSDMNLYLAQAAFLAAGNQRQARTGTSDGGRHLWR